MILIFSTPADEHAAQVLQHLKDLGVRVRFIDLAGFPCSLRLRMHYDQPDHRDFAIIDVDGTSIDCDQVTAAWWRRPELFSIPSEITDPHVRSFAYRESYHALAGLWSSLNTVWVNPPVRDEEAQHKTFQLSAAQEVGLPIPRTLVSNDPDEARRFVQDSVHTGVIFKAFVSTERCWRETRLVTAQEMEVLDSVRYAPVIFQEYIEAVCDLRVTLVGQAVFSAAIYARETTYPVDYRMDLRHARIEPFALPLTVEQRLKDLLRRLGLIYGAVDLRLTSDDHYIFLEVNPSGQWLFVENATGQPISRALARLLAGCG
jgi:glutathione synthase/RimK-type ligase-like ATP-grasp enzyme